MAKRFIDTEIFKDNWFMNLKPNTKLIFIYLITNCDHAGIIDLNLELAQFQTKIKDLVKSWGTVQEELGNSLLRLKSNYYFLPKFIKFQYPNFPQSNVNQQLGAIKRLKEFNLYNEENSTLNEELIKSSGRVQEDLGNSYDNDNDNVNGNIKGGLLRGEENEEKFFRQFDHLKITKEENQKLLNLDYTQEQINLIYDKIENYKKNKNYKSLYLTALTWLKKEDYGKTRNLQNDIDTIKEPFDPKFI